MAIRVFWTPGCPPHSEANALVALPRLKGLVEQFD
jgi:hypothetical protein